MTCQCCGRQIFAQRGKIAHHGYERPGYGWQTASCMGALYLPFEVARERLADLIVALKQHDRRHCKETIGKIKAEKVKLGFSVTIDCEPEPGRRWATPTSRKPPARSFSFFTRSSGARW